MCDFLDTVEARGEARGEAKIIQGLIKTGNMTVEQIADILKLPVEKVKDLAEMVLASA